MCDDGGCWFEVNAPEELIESPLGWTLAVGLAPGGDDLFQLAFAPGLPLSAVAAASAGLPPAATLTSDRTVAYDYGTTERIRCYRVSNQGNPIGVSA